MTNKIVELSDEIELEDGEELDTLETTPDDTHEEEVGTEEVESKIPDKFKDKSIEDVIASYQNLESEFGRRNNEIGELRKLTDQLLQLQGQELNEPKRKEETPSLDVDTLLENPSDAINSALENNPRLKAIEEQFSKQKIDAAKQAFEATHPDWQEVVGSEGFQKWIVASPIRTKMFQEADASYDYASGGELIGLYKELTQGREATAATEQKAKRNKQMKAASTEKSGSSVSSKKVYRRADLINMRSNEPRRYEAMEEDILKAYAEGRVR